MTLPTITVYGATWCGQCRLAKRILDARGLPYSWVDIDTDSAAQELVLRLNGGLRSVPTILLPDGPVLVEPSARELAHRLDRVGAPTASAPTDTVGSSPRGRWWRGRWRPAWWA